MTRALLQAALMQTRLSVAALRHCCEEWKVEQYTDDGDTYNAVRVLEIVKDTENGLDDIASRIGL